MWRSCSTGSLTEQQRMPRIEPLKNTSAEGGDVPEQFECYREMFGWYSSGMDENRLPSRYSPHKEPPDFSGCYNLVELNSGSHNSYDRNRMEFPACKAGAGSILCR